MWGYPVLLFWCFCEQLKKPSTRLGNCQVPTFVGMAVIVSSTASWKTRCFWPVSAESLKQGRVDMARWFGCKGTSVLCNSMPKSRRHPEDLDFLVLKVAKVESLDFWLFWSEDVEKRGCEELCSWFSESDLDGSNRLNSVALKTPTSWSAIASGFLFVKPLETLIVQLGRQFTDDTVSSPVSPVVGWPWVPDRQRKVVHRFILGSQLVKSHYPTTRVKLNHIFWCFFWWFILWWLLLGGGRIKMILALSCMSRSFNSFRSIFLANSFWDHLYSLEFNVYSFSFNNCQFTLFTGESTHIGRISQLISE